MTIGTSMDQEMCLILGHVSLGRETSRRIFVVRVETDKTAGNIQARSFMARTLDHIGRNAKLKEKQKRSMEEPKLDNA